MIAALLILAVIALVLVASLVIGSYFEKHAPIRDEDLELHDLRRVGRP